MVNLTSDSKLLIKHDLGVGVARKGQRPASLIGPPRHCFGLGQFTPPSPTCFSPGLGPGPFPTSSLPRWAGAGAWAAPHLPRLPPLPATSGWGMGRSPTTTTSPNFRLGLEPGLFSPPFPPLLWAEVKAAPHLLPATSGQG